MRTAAAFGSAEPATIGTSSETTGSDCSGGLGSDSGTGAGAGSAAAAGDGGDVGAADSERRTGAGMAAEELKRADQAERALRLAGLQAEREVIYALARHQRISDDTARKLVRNVDLLEARYR